MAYSFVTARTWSTNRCNIGSSESEENRNRERKDGNFVKKGTSKQTSDGRESRGREEEKRFI